MILRGTPAQIRASWFQDGTIADPGEVTITVTGESGAEIAEDAEASGSGAAVRTFDLTDEDTADLDNLTAVWTSPDLGEITTTYEVVGDLLFTEVEARSFRGSKLPSGVTDTTISEARTRITDDFEEILGVAPIPRYRRVVLNGDGGCDLLLPNIRMLNVRTVETREHGTQTWTAFDSDDLADVLVENWGRIERESRGTFPKGRRNIRVGYEHGHERAPSVLKRAALLVLHGSEITTDIDPRSMSYSDGVGTIRFVTPGLTRGAWYDIPEANAILQRFAERVPGVG